MEETKEAIEDIIRREVERAVKQHVDSNPLFSTLTRRIEDLEKTITALRIEVRKPRKWWQL